MKTDSAVLMFRQLLTLFPEIKPSSHAGLSCSSLFSPSCSAAGGVGALLSQAGNSQEATNISWFLPMPEGLRVEVDIS